MTNANKAIFCAYTDRYALIRNYALHLMTYQADLTELVAMDVATAKATYQPHIYRGGYVIPDFGYSVERMGKYTTETTAGNPKLVK